MIKHNIYKNLKSDECDDDISTTTQNEKRKASKKLREIEILERKGKESLTEAEIEKVKMKQKWTNILYPIQKDIKSPNEECKTKQQARRIQKEKEAERREREAERREKERIRHEKIRQEKEQANRLARMLNESESILEEEFIYELAKNGNNVNRAFRLLSLKYHPDRNINKEKIEDSIETQKLLGNIRDKYLQQ